MPRVICEEELVSLTSLESAASEATNQKRVLVKQRSVHDEEQVSALTKRLEEAARRGFAEQGRGALLCIPALNPADIVLDYRPVAAWVATSLGGLQLTAEDQEMMEQYDPAKHFVVMIAVSGSVGGQGTLQLRLVSYASPTPSEPSA